MFDLKINYYARIDYNGFRKLIDAIGGIDMQISDNMNYDDDLQNLHIHFKKGQSVHLDGEKAEEYFRWRKNNDGSGLGTGDLGRIENQHVFIEKVIEKVDSVAVIPKIPKILGILPQYIDTNMSAKDLLKYGSAICTLKKDNITLSTVKGDLCDIEGISYVAYNDKLNQGIINSLHSK
jgi:cell envelope-related function transcriptional attenuator common domain